ncbi:hypothetical protein GCM10010840_27820 [Deinococcus aerolatus]|uniref:Uncharacterized protein n=1 Tax=Deinococcus aerolatus TaxID=522487 RepID=A0ABQ2GDM1_9DEIO|nr:hypothetical protein GCM10010840_27820 [Deinococcus aerolatus]
MRRLLLLATLLGGGALAQNALPGVLTIRFLDVGQGDAVLITAPEGQSLLYDGGRLVLRHQSCVRPSKRQLKIETGFLSMF